MYSINRIDWASDLYDATPSTDDVAADVAECLREACGIEDGYVISVNARSGPVGWPVVSIAFDRFADLTAFVDAYFEGDAP